MYLYFDSHGILKEMINDAPLRRGSTGNYIYVYMEGVDYDGSKYPFPSAFISGNVSYLLIDEGEETPYTQLLSVLTKEVSSIPFNSKRDLKFFKYGYDYQFLKILVPDELILGNSGTVSCSISLLPGTTVLGLVIFDVEEGAMQAEVPLSYAQYNYLFNKFVETFGQYYLKSEVNLLLEGKVDKTNVDAVLHGTDDNGEETIIPYSVNVSTNAVVRRNSSGQVKVPATPTDNSDAASKSYVDAVQTEVNDINSVIPSEASSSNKLADKAWTQEKINEVSAYFITKNAQGQSFATKAELDEATVFYSGGEIRVPTRNDFCYVLEDEDHDGATTKYWWQGNQWEFQILVNEKPLTQAEINALDSGITAAKVATYDAYAASISNKVDKSTSVRILYGTDLSGNQTTYNVVWNSNTGSSVAQRDPSGNIAVANHPVNHYDATSKGYVDGYVSANPTSATSDLSKIKIGSESYNIKDSSVNWLKYYLSNDSNGLHFNALDEFEDYYFEDSVYFTENVSFEGNVNLADAAADLIVDLSHILDGNGDQLIEPNPQGTATSPLSKLKLGSTIYEVTGGGTTLYEHRIYMSISAGTIFVYLTIFNTLSTPFNINSLKTLLTRGPEVVAQECSGQYLEYHVFCMYYQPNQDTFYINYWNKNTGQRDSSAFSPTIIIDDVIQMA